jgi:hypothetical protein
MIRHHFKTFIISLSCVGASVQNLKNFSKIKYKKKKKKEKKPGLETDDDQAVAVPIIHKKTAGILRGRLPPPIPSHAANIPSLPAQVGFFYHKRRRLVLTRRLKIPLSLSLSLL